MASGGYAFWDDIPANASPWPAPPESEMPPTAPLQVDEPVQEPLPPGRMVRPSAESISEVDEEPGSMPPRAPRPGVRAPRRRRQPANPSAAEAEANPRTIWKGLQFIGAPRWRGGRLYFVNGPGYGGPKKDTTDLSMDPTLFATVLSIDPSGGIAVEVMRDHDEELRGDGRHAAGIAWDGDGRLITTKPERGELQIVGGGVSPPLQLLGLPGRSASPGDLAVDAATSRAYVADAHPRSEWACYCWLSAVVEQPVAGGRLLLVDPCRGECTVAAEDLICPAGVVILAGAQLVVAESLADRLTAFDIEAEGGGLTNRRLWASLPGTAPRGIAADAEPGRIWVSSPGTRSCLLVSEGGGVLAAVPTTGDFICSSCAVGGQSGEKLYLLENAGPKEVATGSRIRVVSRAAVISTGSAVMSTCRHCVGTGHRQVPRTGEHEPHGARYHPLHRSASLGDTHPAHNHVCLRRLLPRRVRDPPHQTRSG
eukprot:NODE_1267_length_2542_cov_9.601656.p1 GENE.NODE_1267_length_2542_cov_9.601656~~NODE_1267_length_2542_cov_9.601656.p1  ORF type:complete len:481 (-),score=88.03 NODE_1267_length_2542_cov_9.601656:957-2399(-)